MKPLDENSPTVLSLCVSSFHLCAYSRLGIQAAMKQRGKSLSLCQIGRGNDQKSLQQSCGSAFMSSPKGPGPMHRKFSLRCLGAPQLSDIVSSSANRLNVSFPGLKLPYLFRTMYSYYFQIRQGAWTCLSLKPGLQGFSLFLPSLFKILFTQHLSPQAMWN